MSKFIPTYHKTIGLHDWLQTPTGRYLLDWERARIDAAVVDIFGYHALQLGVPELNGLKANRMPHQWLATEHLQVGAEMSIQQPVLLCDYSALPFPASSLDMVLLPHTLEFSSDPHATLREVERVLVPEGRVVICGLNPASLWGLQQRRSHLYRKMGFDQTFLPQAGEFIGYWRLRDWLRLLGFEVEVGEFGCYRPGVTSEKWLQRMEWMDRAGPRWWPIFGAAYFLVAVKRVHGVRLMGAAWKAAPASVRNPVSVANRLHDH
ncbi:MAG: class I SAM-dependent methyltransferase [Rhodoferax sp.]|nr:class I SAM-dependent methyltransferase [Rhodoferax sp.]